MVKSNTYVKFYASVVAPNPNDIDYWIDLRADWNGNIIKFYDPAIDSWVKLTDASSEYAVAPYIGSNGNWYVENRDTGVSASGYALKIGSNGNWFVFNQVTKEYEDSGFRATGESAYEIAVDNGFVGTEEEWLASLSAASEEAAQIALEAANNANAAADRANLIASNPPRIINGTWWIYNEIAGEYVDTGIRASFSWGNIPGEITDQEDLMALFDNIDDQLVVIDDRLNVLDEKIDNNSTYLEDKIDTLDAKVDEAIDDINQNISDNVNILNDRIDDVAGDVASLETSKQDVLTAGDNITIDADNVISADKDPDIALSDQVLTFDIAGLKANISLSVDGNDVKVLGKINESTGEPYIISEFNVLQSQIIDDVYVQDHILYIIFIVDNDGTPGTETVEIDLQDFIDVYFGSTYITIGDDNYISLNYPVLTDQLINDGFVKTDGTITGYVTLNTAQTITGAKTFANQITTRSVIPVSANDYAIGSSTNYYTNVYSQNLNVVNISPRTGTSVQIETNFIPAATTTYTLGTSARRWNNIFSVIGNFSGAVSVSGMLSFNNGASATAIVPQENSTYTLGNSAARWSNVYTNILFTGDKINTMFGTGFMSAGPNNYFTSATATPPTLFFNWSSASPTLAATLTLNTPGFIISVPFVAATPNLSLGSETNMWNNVYASTFNGVALISDGDGDMFLSDDGTYKTVSGGGTEVDWLNIPSTVVPEQPGLYGLGLPSRRWGNVYIDSLFTGNKITSTDGVSGVLVTSNGEVHLTSSANPGIYFFRNNTTINTQPALIQTSATILSIRATLAPIANDTYSFGSTLFRWGNVFAVNGTFTNRPTVGGINVALISDLGGSGDIDLEAVDSDIKPSVITGVYNLGDNTYRWGTLFADYLDIQYDSTLKDVTLRNITPDRDDYYNIGSTTDKFNTVYATYFNGNVQGGFATTKTINLTGDVTGTIATTFQGDTINVPLTFAGSANFVTVAGNQSITGAKIFTQPIGLSTANSYITADNNTRARIGASLTVSSTAVTTATATLHVVGNGYVTTNFNSAGTLQQGTNKTGTNDGIAGFATSAGVAHLTGVLPTIAFYSTGVTSAGAQLYMSAIGRLLTPNVFLVGNPSTTIGTNMFMVEGNAHIQGTLTMSSRPTVNAVDVALVSDLPDSSLYVTLAGAQTITGIKTFSGTINANNIVPNTSTSYNLGTATARWNTLYASSVSTGTKVLAADGNPGVVLGQDGNILMGGVQNPTITFFRGGGTTATHTLAAYASGMICGTGFHPSATNMYDLGGTSLRWNNIYLRTNLVLGQNKTATATDGNTGIVIGENFVDISGITPYIRFRHNNDTSAAIYLQTSASNILNLSATLRPQSTNTFDLGVSGGVWRNIYSTNAIFTNRPLVGSTQVALSTDIPSLTTGLILSGTVAANGAVTLTYNVRNLTVSATINSNTGLFVLTHNIGNTNYTVITSPYGGSGNVIPNVDLAPGGKSANSIYLNSNSARYNTTTIISSEANAFDFAIFAT